MFVKYFMSLSWKAVYKHKHYYGKSMNKVINQIEQKNETNLQNLLYSAHKTHKIYINLE